MGAPLPFSRGSRAHSVRAHSIKARAEKERLAQPPAPKPDREPATSPIPIGKRGAARLRLSIPAKLVSRYANHRCILIDLSATGAQVGLEEPLNLEETAILEIGGIEPFGEVVRCERSKNGGINGLRFDPELSDADVLKVRAFAENHERDELRSLRSEVRNWVDGLL